MEQLYTIYNEKVKPHALNKEIITYPYHFDVKSFDFDAFKAIKGGLDTLNYYTLYFKQDRLQEIIYNNWYGHKESYTFDLFFPCEGYIFGIAFLHLAATPPKAEFALYNQASGFFVYDKKLQKIFYIDIAAYLSNQTPSSAGLNIYILDNQLNTIGRIGFLKGRYLQHITVKREEGKIKETIKVVSEQCGKKYHIDQLTLEDIYNLFIDDQCPYEKIKYLTADVKNDEEYLWSYPYPPGYNYKEEFYDPYLLEEPDQEH
ncbi:hypothetical protein [Rapidithrix thailandica]